MMMMQIRVSLSGHGPRVYLTNANSGSSYPLVVRLFVRAGSLIIPMNSILNFIGSGWHRITGMNPIIPHAQLLPAEL